MIRFLIFFLLISPLLGQHGDLEFRVYDSDTNEPIIDAHVFVVNSSFGSTTNLAGYVSFDLPSSVTEDIIISHINYDPRILKFVNYEYLTARDSIFLRPNGIEMSAILISDKRSKKWKKQFKKFSKAFLGEDEAAKKCKILNPEVLRFFEAHGTFKATAVDLIRIENDYLKYKIDFLLTELVTKEDGSSGYHGYAKFNDTNQNQDKEVKNRSKVFETSARLFFKSLIDNTLAFNKFELSLSKYDQGKFIKLSEPKASDLIIKDSLSSYYHLYFDDFLNVSHLNVKNYVDVKMNVRSGGLESQRFGSAPASRNTKVQYAQSYLYKVSPYLILDKDGNVINKKDLREFGYWSHQRMATNLPLDYKVDYGLKKENQNDRDDLELLLDLVRDDQNAKRLAINHLKNNWQDHYIAPLLDIIRLSGDQTTTVEITKLLQEKKGKNNIPNYYEGLQWLWNSDLDYAAYYADFKASLYKHLDPKFEKYFKGRHERSTVDIDELMWGGVVQDGIPPLRAPKLIKVEDADYLADDDVIFGVVIDGVAKAYPQRILAWHEFFVDQFGDKRIAGVYCTLCGTVVAYNTRHKGVDYDLGTSGFLYRSNKLMYDRATQSLWNTIEGKPVLGPLVNEDIELEMFPVITTTWTEWKEMYPRSKVLSLNTGHDRNYKSGEAYKEYFSTDDLMFPVPKLDDRLKNKDEVLVIRDTTSKSKLAIDVNFLAEHKFFQNDTYVIVTSDYGASRVYRKNNAAEVKPPFEMTESFLKLETDVVLSRVPSHRTFWFAWYNMHPETVLIK